MRTGVQVHLANSGVPVSLMSSDGFYLAEEPKKESAKGGQLNVS
jgi:hypothetical protein